LVVWIGAGQLYGWNRGEDVAYLTATTEGVTVHRSKHIIGDIDLTRQVAAEPGQPVALHGGDVVSSGRDAAAEIVFPDHSRVFVGDDTQLAIPVLHARSTATPLAIVMRLDRGAVRSQVAHLREGVDRFEINAPNLTARVKGTVFRMDVSSEGTRVATEEGVVSVSWDGKEVDVAAGRELQLLMNGTTADYDLRPQSPILHANISDDQALEADAPIYTNASEITWSVQALPDSEVLFFINGQLVDQIQVNARGQGVITYAPADEGRYAASAITQLPTGEQSLAVSTGTFIVDRTPPPLVFLQPTDPQLTTSKAVLEGRTEPGARVQLNGEELTVDEGGHFITSLALQPGMNTLELSATDRAGNEVSLTSVLVYEQP